MFKQSLLRLAFQPQPQLLHLGSHSRQQPQGVMQGRLNLAKGWGGPLPGWGEKAHWEGWAGWSPDSGRDKPKSVLQILASGPVREQGQALGPCTSLTRDRETAKAFL